MTRDDANCEPTTDARRGTAGRTNRTGRRAFLGTVAAVGGVGLAGCTGSDDGSTSTPTDTPMSTDTPTSTDASTTTAEEETETPKPRTNPDVPILNYALTLEHLENAFYRDGLKEFSDEELIGAKVLQKYGEGVRTDVPGYLERVGNHEAAHVKALTKTVADLGGDPVAEADYDFGYETPSEFLGVAKALENTGVAAYAGAAPSVHSNDILAAAAGIHSVEARHASFLNLVNSAVPFPKAVDEAKSMEEVLEIAGRFITSDVKSPGSGMESDADDGATIERKTDDGTSDLEILNYALTLEHLENAFYRDVLKKFSDEELMDAKVLQEYDEELRMKVPGHLERVGNHEAAHVKALTKTVADLGGDPVAEADYDFGCETPADLLSVAKALENTGVAAYAGAAPSVKNDEILSAALGIHSVEARHASFLNELNVESPFPRAVDEPKSMEEVKKIAGQFIVEA